MTPEELFDIWAPFDSLWSKWAKPAVFTVDDRQAASPDPAGANPPQAAGAELPDLYFLRSGLGETALVVNLPGVAAVRAGLSLAELGYRPVPLFNSIYGPGAVLDVRLIKAALSEGAEKLLPMNLRPDAPPAFLLDSGRMAPRVKPGDFDNRWVVFPQDFPSGTFLQAHGVRRVVLVQQSGALDRDLAQVLALWKRAGLEVMLMDGEALQGGLSSPRLVENLRRINRLDFARAAFAVLLIGSLGLRRGNAGGFGGVIPVPERGG